jgi:hypothetical protein
VPFSDRAPVHAATDIVATATISAGELTGDAKDVCLSIDARENELPSKARFEFHATAR